MVRYIINRVLLLIPVIIVVSFIVFMLVEFAPGTIVDTMISGDMTQEDIAVLKMQYDLDKSMFYRYGKYMLNLIQGNLGVSFTSGLSVFALYMMRLPNTLILTLTGLVIGTAISIPMGILAARKAGTVTDAATTAFALVGMSMPVFWLGLLMMVLFSLRLEWLPAGGYDAGLRSLVMPGICSALVLMATNTRQTRASMLEVLEADFLRTARAKGAPESIVIGKHALGNAMIPVITTLGGSVCVSLAGSAVIEQVFAWPGVGWMLVQAVFNRDVPVITGCVVMTTILYVVVMLIIDLLYAFIDPRIKSLYLGKTRKRKYSAKLSYSTTTANLVTAAKATSNATDASELIYAEREKFDTTQIEDVPRVSGIVSSNKDTNSQKKEQINLNLSLYIGAQDYVTRKNMSIAGGNAPDNVAEVIAKYKKRSQIGEIWHSLIRNKSSLAGIIILSIVFLLAITSIFIPYESVIASNVSVRLSPPSLKYPFGTDTMGRNAFLRVIYGSRYSLIIGFSTVLFSALFGVTLGAAAGYYGRIVDNVIMRISDILASLPGLLLGMVIMVMLGFNIQNLIVAVGIAGIPHFIRMSRASILMVKGNEYVEAAHAMGFSDLRIIFTQVLPNGLSTILVIATMLLGLNIGFAAALSFLGFGIPPPTPEWGGLVAAGREFVRTSPWLMTFPGLFIMITVLGFNLLGDGLRDALDPKQNK